MLKIGKLAQQAIAAASFLAERHGQIARVSAKQIADERQLPRPVVAKILSALSLKGITIGATGPAGGYRLAKHPRNISLYDIVEVFERMDVRPMCPFGPEWCGHGAPCAMHDAISKISDEVGAFLRGQDLGPFCPREEDQATPS